MFLSYYKEEDEDFDFFSAVFLQNTYCKKAKEKRHFYEKTGY